MKFEAFDEDGNPFEEGVSPVEILNEALEENSGVPSGFELRPVYEYETISTEEGGTSRKLVGHALFRIEVV